MAENTIIRRHLLTADTGKRTITSVQAHEIHFAPGQKGGLHLHPCPVTGYIVEGTAMLHPPILHFDNHSDTEPMVFVAFYLLDGEQKLIEMLTD